MTAPSDSPKLPEPVAWYSKTGHGNYVRETLSEEHKALTFAGKPMWQPLYTATQVQALLLASREEAMEEAAKVCDAVTAKWATFHQVAPSASAECAFAIRALSKGNQ